MLALGAAVSALALIVAGQREQRHPEDAIQQQPVAASPESEKGARPDQPVLRASQTDVGRYRALSDYLANRYRVSQEVAFDLVRLAHQVGQEVRLDPLLIIAVIAIESSFNPIAESGAGAKGLMQIIPKYHVDKLQPFGGEGAVFDPVTNIQVGARILKEYIRNTGNVGIGLQMYAGALQDPKDEYTNRVLGMKQRLQHVAVQSPNRFAAGPIRTASARNSRESILAID